jgi:hypothetical protein
MNGKIVRKTLYETRKHDRKHRWEGGEKLIKALL